MAKKAGDMKLIFIQQDSKLILLKANVEKLTYKQLNRYLEAKTITNRDIFRAITKTNTKLKHNDPFAT